MILSNLHTHTVFCDGESTVDEIVKSAIEKGFSAIGFSGHGYMDFDHSYCMMDTESYKKQVLEAKEHYKKDIEVYLGIEEDAYSPINRAEFDYIIGSLHYVEKKDARLTIDENYEGFLEAFALFQNDPIQMAENYYTKFVDYILKRKPDIVGHFDLITKFDEKFGPYFTGNAAYEKMAEAALLKALKSDCIFEVNTGAISRGYRKTPYPAVNLLHILKRENVKIILTADSHHKDTIDCAFDETRALLKDIGFTHTYALHKNEFIKTEI